MPAKRLRGTSIITSPSSPLANFWSLFRNWRALSCEVTTHTPSIRGIASHAQVPQQLAATRADPHCER